MRLVVADTSPLNYLVLIGQVEILPALFERIFVPQTVQNELRHDEATESVRRWIAAPPLWLEIVPADQGNDDPELLRLDEGERAAILLATQIGADLLLIDDRDGCAREIFVGKEAHIRLRWGRPFRNSTCHAHMRDRP